MALTPGTRLGVYEVTAPIGEGGMGQVYRATDTRLKRQVALKILPPSLATDPDRLARFQREAEVLASLNHPHIAAIYGLENGDGVKALVMELVEGDDLSQRIARGPIPLDEALPIATQVVEALEAAHEQGIIHRDLKPANIKVRADGTVKVLDFGLAKALEPASVGGDLSQSPTITSPAVTRIGVILGTAAYMSPEQARGKRVDKRADIWAFGCVLYETLTGRAAYEGEDIPEILSRVLQREPNWALLPPNVPPRIRELLRLCLQKDIRKRRSDAADVRIDIEQAVAEPAAATPATPPVRGGRLAWIAFAGAALVAAMLAIPAVRYLRETPLPEMRVEINTPQTPLPLHFALSPDGMRLVFVASGNGPQRLWVRSLDAVAPQPLLGTGGASFPFWSPDSRSVGFFADGKLKRIDVDVGSPHVLADAPAGRGGAWSSDGTILFATTNASPLWRVPASGGQPVEITKLDLPQGSHRLPQFLPDGRHFLFFASGSPDAQGIYLGLLDGGDTKRLTAADAAGSYMEPELLVFNRQGALVARHLDVASGALTGDLMRLAESVDYDSTFGLGGFSVSAAGRVSYRVSGVEHRQLRWFDRTGTPVGVAGQPDLTHLSSPELSPGGRDVAVIRDVQNNYDVWLIDLLRGGATRFTSDAAVELYPLWSPDGTQIAFNSNRKGIYDIYLKPSSGASSEELLLESPRVKIPVDWSRDGRFMLYQEADPKTGWDLWALPMSGNRKPIAIANTPFEERAGQFSPDGRWVAYQSNVTGSFEIYVQSFPGPGGKWKVSTAGGTYPRWRADGQELFFIAPDAKLMAASVQTSSSSVEAGSPTALFQTRIVIGENFKHEYAVSRDGRFLVNTVLDDAASPITLLVNWKPPTK